MIILTRLGLRVFVLDNCIVWIREVYDLIISFIYFNTRFTDTDYIFFFNKIYLFDGYIKMQFFVNFLFKI